MTIKDKTGETAKEKSVYLLCHQAGSAEKDGKINTKKVLINRVFYFINSWKFHFLFVHLHLMNKITWLPVKNYENYYEVSSLGEVRSVERLVRHEKGGNRLMKSKTLKPSINNKGYLRVILARNGKNRAFSVHRLIAETFIPNPKNLPQVNHVNLVKLHNWVDNLEWCTNRENTLHAIKSKNK